MAENQLPFRALDNSSTTRMGYSLEANHWVNALTSAQASTTSALAFIPFIGALLTIFMCLLFMIMIGIVSILEWIFKSLKGKETPAATQRPNVPLDDGDNSFYQTW